ncbi:hypothetical protein [Tessaracoccus oleiagri]|uniref:Uncharacterized protein n=1 Tax=Tessaracoccus oleiagri TaxID=686624 RepID=A0A1G9HTJ9_9ACTN|nr:hypothetical protein [Tessaracoccus oleiagri]SDL16044.1 hypothetical protein SAMN04488242_0505 [Tessaracoccus oleiagri]
MQTQTEPSSVVAFTFSGGLVESVTIADGWSGTVDPEQFGSLALVAFHEQRARATAPSPTGPGAGPLRVPASVRDDVGQRLQALNTRAFAALRSAVEMLDAKSAPPEPETHTDRYRHVTVTARGGHVTGIEVSPRHLSQDPVQIEHDLAEALNSALGAARAGGPGDDLAALWAEHASISKILDDYREPPR